MATEPSNHPNTIVKLRAADLPRLETLLHEHRLPTDDCAAQLPAFCGIFEDAQLIAAGGLETAGDFGLLRSVVVDPAHRGQGLARLITNHLVDQARQMNLRAIYLLTETADAYFTRLGFERVDRDSAPQPITQTRQFAGLCPDSAVFMRLSL